MSSSKILIVDDELSIRIMLTRMIEPLRHEVLSAEDGQAALEMVRKNGIDLVISDLMMPKMDGLSLLEHVREEGFDCAFILLTGFGDLPQALAARDRFNISNFLVKPIHNMDQFLFDVESALTRRTLERENQQLLERMRNINVQLEEKVRERTRELEQKNEELDRVSNFRADALKVLGHELRTPLAILAGYQSLIEQVDADGFRALSPAMRSSIERLQRIVERSLTLLRAAEMTEFPLELTPVSPPDLCQRVAKRLQPFLDTRDVQLVVPPDCTIGLQCQWDQDKIEEVIEELVINAVRASQNGSRVELLVTTDRSQVTLDVKDYGIGIPDADRERAFEPFVTLQQAEHHSSGMFERGAEGVGIGLSTARMWVSLHHGTIRAEANEGLPGTTIRVQLPVDAAEPEAVQQSA